MGLNRYNEKRNFTKSPEPKGGIKHADNGPIFVIQRHEATALHFDFRIESEGVLKSWAVPKGPPTKPKEKHLAMMVEDHPLDYADFEGVIPEGNYGAGNVEIWDSGTYDIEGKFDKEFVDKKIADGLARGKITLNLYGGKIKGEYALLKLKNAKEKNAWIMIKANKSQVSSLKPDQLTQMPDKITPMMAQLAKEPFDDNKWLFEIKWDGYRTIAYISDGKANLRSRNQKSFNEKFGEIRSSLEDLSGNLIIDGEVVVLDNHGLPKFSYIQNYERYHEGYLYYYVFDLLFRDGIDYRNMPLETRRRELETIPLPRKVRLSDAYLEFGRAFFNQIKERDLEGMIAKERSSKYEEGARSKNWLKIKTEPEQEAVIGGFSMPASGRLGFGSLLLGVYDSNGLRYIGSVGTGFDNRFLKEFRSMLDNITIPKSPFYNPPKKLSGQYVKPQFVCQIKFREWTEDGLVRQPVFLGLREDKEPNEVTREQM